MFANQSPTSNAASHHPLADVQPTPRYYWPQEMPSPPLPTPKWGLGRGRSWLHPFQSLWCIACIWAPISWPCLLTRCSITVLGFDLAFSLHSTPSQHEPMIKQVEGKPFPLLWSSIPRHFVQLACCCVDWQNIRRLMIGSWVRFIFLCGPVLSVSPGGTQLLGTGKVWFYQSPIDNQRVSHWSYSDTGPSWWHVALPGDSKRLAGSGIGVSEVQERGRPTLQGRIQAVFLSWVDILACSGACPGRLYPTLWPHIWGCITILGTKGSGEAGGWYRFPIGTWLRSPYQWKPEHWPRCLKAMYLFQGRDYKSPNTQ